MQSSVFKINEDAPRVSKIEAPQLYSKIRDNSKRQQLPGNGQKKKNHSTYIIILKGISVKIASFSSRNRTEIPSEVNMVNNISNKYFKQIAEGEEIFITICS